MGGGSQQQQSSTSKTEPWEAQQPYLEHGFSEAGRLYGEGPAQYYPGQTFVDQSDPTKAGLAAQTGLASGGNPLVDNAASFTNKTLTGQQTNPYASMMEQTANGDFLTSNPHLDSVFDSAARKVSDNFSKHVVPGINNTFGQGGMTGSTMHELAMGEAGGGLTDSLGSLAADIYGGDYQQERSRQTGAQQSLFGQTGQQQMGALGAAPGIREAQFGDAQKLQEAGKAYEGFGEKVLEDDINRFNYGQNSDMAALQDYLAMISGNFGSTSTSRSSGGSSGSGLNSALGGVAALASLFGGQ